MSSSIENANANFIEETYVFPEDDPEQYDVTLRQYLSKIARNMNSKDSGVYTDEEVITGQRFVPTFSTTKSNNINYREVFRKVIDFGALPDTTTKTVAHGISTTEDFSIVKIYGAATDPDPGAGTINFGIPLPFIGNVPPNDNIQLGMDATNIIVITNSNTYIAFTRSFVVVEYIKEV